MNRLNRLFSILVLLAAPLGAAARESSITNPTGRSYQDELVRLPDPASGEPGTFIVKRDGAEVPYQVERIDGAAWVWVCGDFAPGETHHYEMIAGKPKPAAPRVAVKQEGDSYVLDNGEMAIRLPAAAKGGGAIPGPVSGVRMGDKWVGGGTWNTSLALKQFSAAVIGDGTLFGKVRLRYDFDGMAGIDGKTPAFAEVDVSVGPGWKHAQLFERHEMQRGDYWEFEASRGWSPTQGVSKPFSGGAGSGEVSGKIEPSRALKPGGLPVQRPDLYINLFPRWNQHYKDGWFFAASDGRHHVGAVVVRASQWIWPHDNSIECIVHASGDYAGVRGSTWHGQRLWWLFAPTLDPASIDYVARYAWEPLDKLNREFILDWPGQASAKAGKGGGGWGMNFYDSGQMNPTGGLRGAGRNAIKNAGKTGDLATLYRVQAMMHPDAYGSYWNYWSPENCNFFTDFNKLPIALTAQLRDHPQFQKLRQAAEAKLREDLYHSITLPGGAGQECPGYSAYALKNWGEMAPLCKQYLGFDPTTWERYKAAQSFQQRITQPDGEVRRQLPMGDTHPAKNEGPAIVDVPADRVKSFTTVELPGFGVIFSNRPGTPKETYLAFKAGPNRGHYHGDQLAFHLGFDAHPVAVDHHSSYHPRAGQEHMHNRLAFHTDDMPYANMDGYERLIAFKTSPRVDVAMAQVESRRLRAVTRLPPETWDQRWPEHAFKDGALTYRRTIVFMKAEQPDGKDYFVLRDQFWAPEPLSATYCLHVLSDQMKQKGAAVDFGKLTLYCAQPAKFDFESFPWSHDNGGHEATQGARLSVKGTTGEFITVLYPGQAPPIEAIPGGVKVGSEAITFAGNQPTAGGDAVVAAVVSGGKELLKLTGADIDLDRSQGDIGLFVPDAGYPFGEIPDWLIKQRAGQSHEPYAGTGAK